MAAVIEPLMTGQPAPWLLYMAGCFMALILEWTGVPALAFALGMYLPLDLNTPDPGRRHRSPTSSPRAAAKDAQRKRKEKGTLMASGFVAGGAIMGVVVGAGPVLRQDARGRRLDAHLHDGTVVNAEGWSVVHALNMHDWVEENPWSAVLALVLFFSVCFYLYKGARSAASD